MHHKNVHALIARNYKYVGFAWQKELWQMQLRLQSFKWEDSLDYPGRPDLIRWTLRSREFSLARVGDIQQTGSVRYEAVEGSDPLFLALKMRGATSQGMQAASVRWEWSLANSHQEKWGPQFYNCKKYLNSADHLNAPEAAKPPSPTQRLQIKCQVIPTSPLKTQKQRTSPSHYARIADPQKSWDNKWTLF